MVLPSLARRLGAASLLTTLVLTSASCGGDLEELSAEEFYPAVMAALQEADSLGFSVTTRVGPPPPR